MRPIIHPTSASNHHSNHVFQALYPQPFPNLSPTIRQPFPNLRQNHPTIAIATHSPPTIAATMGPTWRYGGSATAPRRLGGLGLEALALLAPLAPSLVGAAARGAAQLPISAERPAQQQGPAPRWRTAAHGSWGGSAWMIIEW